MGEDGKGGTAKGSGQEWRKLECAACNRVLNGSHEYAVHLASRQHKRRVAALRKKERQMAHQAAAG